MGGLSIMMSALSNFIAVVSFVAIIVASLAYPMFHQYHTQH